ncbi:superoxide dismutase family protein [Sphingomonas sp.]|uniref:superoxide dismutase family protein n=1 Tax=Sphingomonas sp. TaxID=28214 RepID=UPI00286E9D73|nr:superoxide dismutase family protein [Sphingomonas sp.]
MKNIFPLLALVPLAACGGEPAQQPVSNDSTAVAAAQPATAALNNAAGNNVGQVSLTEGPDGVTIKLAATGLSPGAHGIHVHTVGRCEGPKFDSAGPHWNPAGKKHGRDNPDGAHLGDLVNFDAAADGRGEASFVIAGATLREGAQAVIDGDGAAVVIHAKADDYKTDPSGDSGDRIACATLGG